MQKTPGPDEFVGVTLRPLNTVGGHLIHSKGTQYEHDSRLLRAF